ncbi:MAG: glutamine synthetase family protein [Coriobacteriales bacterium]|jgi:glutamine synthetase
MPDIDAMSSLNAANRDYVLKTVKERHIHFIRMWFTDVLGQMKSFAITPSELEASFEEGMGFDGSSIEGFARSSESDMIAFPDASTFQVLPWRPTDDGVARMFCNICTPDGEQFEGDPRYVLRRMLRKAADLGYQFNVGPEVEYFYFKDAERPVPLDYAGYFDLTADDTASDLRRDTILTLEQMGIPVEYSHHEAAPSQQEIDLRYDDALSMADAVMTYRLVVKEVALKHGVHASFMPKPIAGINGSGMHVHQSLFSDDENIFYDANDPQGFGLSEIAKHYMAGLLKYAPEFTLITNQYVNSYKRLVPGFEAPITISWAGSNRNALIRVPRYKPGKPEAARFEFRSPDSACNPYLVFAVLLGAGLKGIEEGLELEEPIDNDVSEMNRAELVEQGVRLLPGSLGEATTLFAQSELMKEILGEDMHRFIVENKLEEWGTYCSQVTQWEIDRDFPIL